MATPQTEPFLKYALFCRDSEEAADGELTLTNIVDLIDLPATEESEQNESGVLAEIDVQLAFCIGGAEPGPHHLLVAIKAPGVPLDTPPPQVIDWEEDILFQRWIKVFRIPVQRAGLHIAAILLDGIPLGEASFLVRVDGKSSSTGTG